MLFVFLWKFKVWIAMAIFLVLYIVQIAYTNHLAGKLNQAEAKCQQSQAKIHRQYQNKANKAAKAYLDALARRQSTINQLSADYETEKAKQKVKVETVIRYVDKIVERDVYRNICADDDGVQQLNSLIKSRSTR